VFTRTSYDISEDGLSCLHGRLLMFTRICYNLYKDRFRVLQTQLMTYSETEDVIIDEKFFDFIRRYSLATESIQSEYIPSDSFLILYCRLYFPLKPLVVVFRHNRNTCPDDTRAPSSD